MSAQGLAGAAFAAPTPPPTTDKASIADGLSALSTYIPAEGLALYVAITAITLQYKWLALIAALVLNGLITGFKWSDARAKLKGQSDKGDATIARLILILFVVGALLSIYISALPQNALLPNNTLLSGIIVLVVAAFLPILGPRIGLTATRSS